MSTSLFWLLRLSIYAFASLFGIPTVITSSAVELKIHAITAAIKKCKSIIKKKTSKEVLFFAALFDFFVNRD